MTVEALAVTMVSMYRVAKVMNDVSRRGITVVRVT